jgi:hypothetical protein
MIKQLDIWGRFISGFLNILYKVRIMIKKTIKNIFSTEVLAKVNLVIFPIFLTFFITWGSWVTAETFRSKNFREYGTRFSPVDAEKLKSEITASYKKGDTDVYKEIYNLEQVVEDEIKALPPQDWRDKINKMEANQSKMQSDLVRALTILERLDQ